MSHHSDLNYRLYSLARGNPYIHRDLDARREHDRELLIDFAGFPHLSEIESHIESTCATGRSTAFLVSGRDGAGRATFSRTIFQRYMEHRQISDNFLTIRFDETDHRGLSRIGLIIKAIRNALSRHAGYGEHRERLLREIPEGTGDLTKLDLQGRAEFLADFAHKMEPRVHLGLLIYGVQEDDFMDLLAGVFEHLTMVIVVIRKDYQEPTTASDKGLAEREEWQKWARHLTLPPLTGHCVGRLATNRWGYEAPDVPCPFDMQGLATTFSTRPAPVGKALGWLGWLLDRRLKRYQGSLVWPHAAELAIPGDWIEMKVQDGETAPRH